MSARPDRGRGALAVLCALAVALTAGAAAAQREAVSDTLPDGDATAVGSSLSGLMNQARQGHDGAIVKTVDSGPFFGSLTFTPKAGVKANVRQNTYYGETTLLLNMRGSSTFTNTLKWNYDQYRKQDKTVDSRNGNFNYALPRNLPLVVRLDGDWSWSEDKTTNTAGFNNLFAQDNKSLRLAATRTKYRTGDWVHSLKLGGSMDDRQSENQGTRNNSREATLDGGLQSGWEIAQGIVLAGRIYGRTSSGDRTLGAKESPSSALGDTLGVGVYWSRARADGLVAVTRSNFERRFLDFRKNSSGLIDTVGVAEDLKVVRELETKDAMTVELENEFRFGRFVLATGAARTTDDLDYTANGQGLKQRHLDKVVLGSGLGVGVDSLAVTYEFGWKWDDQRIQGATANRGRQYTKSRDLEFVWTRPLFAATDFKLRLYQGLFQNIAENEHNQNDKDRLQSDFSVSLGRRWPSRFATNLVYAYRSNEDRSIRSTRSSNNNIKTSYEIAPDYTWYVAPWLTWDQVYRVYIQYTDYVYSHLEQVSREDNYNKRGNLTTKVMLYPTSRLTLVLRHDYNKKFNATRSGEDATGNVYYRRDLNQTISKLDVGMTFKVLTGVTLEAATYRTRDDRESFGRVSRVTTDYSGEIWVGTKVDKKIGRDIQVFGTVKKYNAFGPSVTETSSDYWEADFWVKWEF